MRDAAIYRVLFFLFFQCTKYTFETLSNNTQRSHNLTMTATLNIRRGDFRNDVSSKNKYLEFTIKSKVMESTK